MVQHLFLSYLYTSAEAEKVAFKGGTALRLLFQSPRFSEDLDFSAQIKLFRLERLLDKTVDHLAREGLSLQTQESKPTSGGYLAIYSCGVHDERIGLEVNVSTRGKVAPEPILVNSPLVPAYQCLILSQESLVQEKLQALLFRKKPRDFYDLYFLLRNRLAIQAIVPLKDALLREVQRLDARILQRELKIFLPISQHKIAAALPQALRTELARL